MSDVDPRQLNDAGASAAAAANASQRNRQFSALSEALGASGASFTAMATAFAALASAVTSSLIGGTTGGTANRILTAKGTTGRALQASSVDVDTVVTTTIPPASGDIIYYSGSAWTRLAKASDTNVLTLASGLPSWAAVSAAVSAATQAEEEAGTSTTVYTSPGRQQFHPSASKSWVKFTKNGTVSASYNTTSITDNGTGDWTVNIGTDFSSANYSGVVATGTSFGNGHYVAAMAAGTFQIQNLDGTGTGVDPTVDLIFAQFFGDQA